MKTEFIESTLEQDTLAWLKSASWCTQGGNNDLETVALVEECNVQSIHIAGLHVANVEGGLDPKITDTELARIRADSERTVSRRTGHYMWNDITSVSRDINIQRCTTARSHATRRLPERRTGDVEQVSASKLGAAAMTKEFLAVQTADNRPVCRSMQSFYLDAVLSGGCRGKSLRRPLFHRLSACILPEHLLPWPTSREHRGPNANAIIGITA